MRIRELTRTSAGGSEGIHRGEMQLGCSTRSIYNTNLLESGSGKHLSDLTKDVAVWVRLEPPYKRGSRLGLGLS